MFGMLKISLLLPLLLLLPAFSRSDILLPTPPGPSNVQLKILELVDHSRVDPSAPCCNAPRRLMVSVFSPTACHKTSAVPYMPPATSVYYNELISPFGVPNGTISSLHLQVCPASSSAMQAPLALFSTGLGTSRLIYSSYLQW